MSAQADDALLADLTAFARRLRVQGVNVEPHRLRDFVEALAATSHIHTYWIGRATLIADVSAIPTYDRAFRAHFGVEPSGEQDPSLPSRRASSAGLVGMPGDGVTEQTSKYVPASQLELLRRKRFEDCDESELAQVAAMITELRWRVPARRTRRRQPGRRGEIDSRRTLEATLRHGGEPVELRRQLRRRRRRRLVLVLDVSRSMEAYSRMMLLFAHSALGVDSDWEAFCFATRLTRLTPALRSRDPNHALRLVGEVAADLAGGTRIGDSLRTLVAGWGHSRTLRGSVVVICSDGLDRGDPALVGAQMVRLARLAYEIVWLSPLKGLPGYEPLTRGMQAALPHIGELVAADTLAALEELAQGLYGSTELR